MLQLDDAELALVVERDFRTLERFGVSR